MVKLCCTQPIPANLSLPISSSIPAVSPSQVCCDAAPGNRAAQRIVSRFKFPLGSGPCFRAVRRPSPRRWRGRMGMGSRASHLGVGRDEKCRRPASILPMVGRLPAHAYNTPKRMIQQARPPCSKPRGVRDLPQALGALCLCAPKPNDPPLQNHGLLQYFALTQKPQFRRQIRYCEILCEFSAVKRGINYTPSVL